MSQFGDLVVWVGRSGRRVAVTTIGFTLVAVGGVLLVVPGPGLLFIAAGLAVLATEYSWARRALDAAKQRAGGATRKLRRQS